MLKLILTLALPFFLAGCVYHSATVLKAPVSALPDLPVDHAPLADAEPSTLADPNVLRYFMEIALGSEYGLGDFTIKKWVADIHLEVLGEPTGEDLEILQGLVAELNELLEMRIRVDLVPSGGNVKLYFIPHQEFSQYEPPGIVFYGGFFWNWWNFAGEIHSGQIVIGSDRLSQTERNHLIREEVTQMLGLMNDSMRYRDSIFYQGRTETDSFSEIDRQLIRMLYSDDISAGMNIFDLRATLLAGGGKY